MHQRGSLQITSFPAISPDISPISSIVFFNSCAMHNKQSLMVGTGFGKSKVNKKFLDNSLLDICLISGLQCLRLYSFRVLKPPCGSSDKESAYNAGRPGFDPRVGKIPWRRERLPTPVF